MDKHFFLILSQFLFLFHTANSQCTSGDCQNGYGEIKYQDGTYKGMFLNGLPHGHGIRSWNNGDKYVGAYLQGTKTGRGIYYWYVNIFDSKDNPLGIQGYYDGDWINDQKCGWGKRQFNSGDYYEGSYLNDAMNGYGTYYFKSGAIYTGSIKDGNFFGYGIMKYKDGYVFMGQFRYDKRNGEGVLINSKTGEQSFGKWENDVKTQ